jgi:hypothetical protein
MPLSPVAPAFALRTFLQFLSGLDSSAGPAPCEMRVFLAYEDLAAALWATETLCGLRHRLPRRPELHSFPWSFSTLENPRYRAHTEALATQADLIVVAISNAFLPLPAPFESWLQTCLAGRRRADAAVAALMRRATLPAPADSPRLRTVRSLAERAGCDFFDPSVPEPAS